MWTHAEDGSMTASPLERVGERRRQPLFGDISSSPAELQRHRLRNYLADDHPSSCDVHVNYIFPAMGSTSEVAAEYEAWERRQVWLSGWKRVAMLLRVWYENPEAACDPEDSDPDPVPTKASIIMAARMAHQMFRRQWVEPDQVISSSDGGIVFYSDQPQGVTKSLRVSPKGALRFLSSSAGKVLSSTELDTQHIAYAPPIWEVRFDVETQ